MGNMDGNRHRLGRSGGAGGLAAARGIEKRSGKRRGGQHGKTERTIHD
jgi:hypothetical protein